MAATGRKPIPSKVQRRKGAYVKDPQRENKLEPKVPTDMPKKDKRLVGKRLATAKFKEVSANLKVMNLQSRVDSDTVVRYALAWQLMMDSLELIDKHGFKLTSPTGAWKVNPANAVYFQANAQLDKLSAQLGIGAANRVSLKANPEQEEADPFAQFMERQKNMNN